VAGKKIDPNPTAVELFAILRAAKAAEKVRDHLPEGTSTFVDIELRLHGLLQVGLNEIRERTVKPEMVNLLGLILEYLTTPVRRRLEKQLDSAFSLADSQAWPECCPESRVLAEQALARWSRKEESMQRGTVTGGMQVEVLARRESA
jgi:hypothetical protein